MRKFFLVAAMVLALLAPAAARADAGSITAGAVLGGLAGSVYASGLNATAAALGSAATSTVAAIGSHSKSKKN